MSDRGHGQHRHRACRGGGLPSVFEERHSLLDRSLKGLAAANPPVVPSSDEEVYSDNEIFREIENYAMEEE